MRRYVAALMLVVGLASTSAASEPGWRSVSTEHFTIIYRSRDQWAADELVSYAEDVYDEVTGLFRSSPDHVDVVLFGESDLANGYYSPAPPQHIGLYIAQPTLPWMGARTESWLRLLFVHELTHYVHANYRHGLFYLLGTVFGRTLTGFSLSLQPPWTTEGLGVNAETMFTAGGRGRDPFFEMRYKAPAIEGRLFSLAQAGYTSHLAPDGRFYVAGYFVWDYLLRTFGEEYVAEFMDSVSGFPLFGIWGPVRETTGSPMQQLYGEATADLIRRYADAAARQPADRLSPAVRSDYYLPTPTERGLYLYRTRPDRTPAVVRFDPETGQETPLLEMRLTDHASWSATADGATIAFSAYTSDRTFPDERGVYSNVFLRDVESGRTRQLTTGGGYHQPALAPDGSYVAAVERVNGHHRLVKIDIAHESDGAADRRPSVLFAADATRIYTPVTSPDGSTVAIAANQRGLQQIVLVDAQNGDYRVLDRPADGVPYFPTFQDDSTLLYGGDRDGELALYRHDIDTGAVELVATDPVGTFAGRLIDDELILSAYTSDGYTLRTAETDDLPVPTGATSETAVPMAGPSQLAPVEDPAPVVGTGYAPTPAPRFWFPWLGLAGPGLEPGGFGGGALVFGADVFQRNSWQVSALYFPGYGQLDYSAQWLTRFGAVTFQAAAASQYLAQRALLNDQTVTLHTKLFQHAGYFSYALLSRYRLGVSDRITVGAGAVHSLLYYAQRPFPLTGLSSPSVALQEPLVTIGADLSLSRTPLASQRAYLAPGAIAATLSVSAPLALPDVVPNAAVVRASGTWNIGIAGSDHAIALSPQASYATDVLLAAPYNLRGFGARTDHTASAGLKGTYRLSLDYHPPYLLTDVPLFASVGITALGFGVFAEATGGYSVEAPSLAPDREIAFGAEFTTVVTYWEQVPLTIGLAARIDPTRPGSFSFPGDVALYFESDLLESIPVVPQYLLSQ